MFFKAVFAPDHSLNSTDTLHCRFDTSFKPQFPILANGRNLQDDFDKNIVGYLGFSARKQTSRHDFALLFFGRIVKQLITWICSRSPQLFCLHWGVRTTGSRLCTSYGGILHTIHNPSAGEIPSRGHQENASQTISSRGFHKTCRSISHQNSMDWVSSPRRVDSIKKYQDANHNFSHSPCSSWFRGGNGGRKPVLWPGSRIHCKYVAIISRYGIWQASGSYLSWETTIRRLRIRILVW